MKSNSKYIFVFSLLFVLCFVFLNWRTETHSFLLRVCGWKKVPAPTVKITELEKSKLENINVEMKNKILMNYNKNPNDGWLKFDASIMKIFLGETSVEKNMGFRMLREITDDLSTEPFILIMAAGYYAKLPEINNGEISDLLESAIKKIEDGDYPRGLKGEWCLLSGEVAESIKNFDKASLYYERAVKYQNNDIFELGNRTFYVKSGLNKRYRERLEEARRKKNSE